MRCEYYQNFIIIWVNCSLTRIGTCRQVNRHSVSGNNSVNWGLYFFCFFFFAIYRIFLNILFFFSPWKTHFYNRLQDYFSLSVKQCGGRATILFNLYSIIISTRVLSKKSFNKNWTVNRNPIKFSKTNKSGTRVFTGFYSLRQNGFIFFNLLVAIYFLLSETSNNDFISRLVFLEQTNWVSHSPDVFGTRSVGTFFYHEIERHRLFAFHCSFYLQRSWEYSL